MCPMERSIVVAQNWPKPPCLRSLFLRAGYKRAVLGTKILSNGKGHFSPTNRDNWTGQSGPNILVGPNQNGLFHLMYQAKFLKFFVEWKAPQNSLEDFFYQPLHYYYTVQQRVLTEQVYWNRQLPSCWFSASLKKQLTFHDTTNS